MGFPQIGKRDATYSSFILDTTTAAPENASVNVNCDAFHADAKGAGCAICQAGLCSASIRNARLADVGCVPIPPLTSIAATAASRCTMCRPP
jgi:hypothetical protein